MIQIPAIMPTITSALGPAQAQTSVTAHFVAMVGIDEQNALSVVDPYSQGTGGSVRTVDWADFWWGWMNNNDGTPAPGGIDYGGQGWWMVLP